MSDLHAAIMNLPGNPLWDGDDLRTYKEGHRDARHAAAALAQEHTAALITENAALRASHQRLKEALAAIEKSMSGLAHVANHIGVNDADGFYLGHAHSVIAQAREALRSTP